MIQVHLIRSVLMHYIRMQWIVKDAGGSRADVCAHGDGS
jgi:hypothetical protein